jgi:hypothetical protein
MKARECAVEVHPAGKCAVGGTCSKGRQPATRRINLEEYSYKNKARK